MVRWVVKSICTFSRRNNRVLILVCRARYLLYRSQNRPPFQHVNTTFTIWSYLPTYNSCYYFIVEQINEWDECCGRERLEMDTIIWKCRWTDEDGGDNGVGSIKRRWQLKEQVEVNLDDCHESMYQVKLFDYIRWVLQYLNWTWCIVWGHNKPNVLRS